MPKQQDKTGCYQRSGGIWWIKYSINGKPHYESSESIKLDDAIRLRRRRLKEVRDGLRLGGSIDRILVNELLNDYLHYSHVKNRQNTYYDVTTKVERYLRPYFGKFRASKFTTQMSIEYRSDRKAEGLTDTTVDRHLSCLRKAFNLGHKNTPCKVAVVPNIFFSGEDNVRNGFLQDDEYAVLLEELPEYLKPVFVVANWLPIRRGELTCIRSWQVNFEERIIELQTGETKNDESRNAPIPQDSDVEKYLRLALKRRDELFPNSPWAFCGGAGDRIKEFKESWAAATKKASEKLNRPKLADLRFHDLRRTANRNMRRAGVDASLRRKIGGWKGFVMESRYNIVDIDDIREAGVKMGTWEKERNRKGAKPGSEHESSNGLPDVSQLSKDEKKKFLQALVADLG